MLLIIKIKNKLCYRLVVVENCMLTLGFQMRLEKETDR